LTKKVFVKIEKKEFDQKLMFFCDRIFFWWKIKGLPSLTNTHLQFQPLPPPKKTAKMPMAVAVSVLALTALGELRQLRQPRQLKQLR
jgi:hypothetical protein